MTGGADRGHAGRATILIWFAGIFAFTGANLAQGASAVRPEVKAFIEEMVQKHRFHRSALHGLFRQIQLRPAVIRAISSPITARPWHEFRQRYVDATRIAQGVAFWQRHADTLARASRDFGVPAEIIVATLGIETIYGRTTGRFRVLEALATLAFDYPPRAEFFRGELEEYLLLARETGMDPLSAKGSYAGAMGIPQFLPSSYRRYAVDFDGNGKRDLWRDPADAIGSVANYYRSLGWRPGEQAIVPAKVVNDDIDALLASGIKPYANARQLERNGVFPLEAVPDDAEVALFSVQEPGGLRYFLGLNNFYVITRYNRSVNYAMAVLELGRVLQERVQFATDGGSGSR